MKTFIYAHSKSYKSIHNIENLFETCVNVSENDNMRNMLANYSDFIKDLNVVSECGFAARYPLSREGFNYLKYVYVIDVKMLRNTICDFTNLLSRFAYGHVQYF